jgi:hypothetical protein
MQPSLTAGNGAQQESHDSHCAHPPDFDESGIHLGISENEQNLAQI